MMLAFIHIPKTSGMSFKDFIFSNLGADGLAWYMINFFDEDFLDKSEMLSNKFRFVGGHLSYGRYMDMNLGEVRFCSILRDPLERIYSYYNHIVVRDQNHPLREQLSSRSLVEGIKNCKTFRDEITNGQCHYLTAKNTFEEALEVIQNNKFILGDVRNIEPFLDAVLQACNVTKNVNYSRANSAENNYISEFKNKETDDFLMNFIGEDLKLYSYVRQLYA